MKMNKLKEEIKALREENMQTRQEINGEMGVSKVDEKNLAEYEMMKEHHETMRGLHTKYDKTKKPEKNLQKRFNKKGVSVREQWIAHKYAKSDERAKEWGQIIKMECHQNRIQKKLNEHNAWVSKLDNIAFTDHEPIPHKDSIMQARLHYTKQMQKNREKKKSHHGYEFDQSVLPQIDENDDGDDLSTDIARLKDEINFLQEKSDSGGDATHGKVSMQLIRLKEEIKVLQDENLTERQAIDDEMGALDFQTEHKMSRSVPVEKIKKRKTKKQRFKKKIKKLKKQTASKQTKINDLKGRNMLNKSIITKMKGQLNEKEEIIKEERKLDRYKNIKIKKLKLKQIKMEKALCEKNKMIERYQKRGYFRNTNEIIESSKRAQKYRNELQTCNRSYSVNERHHRLDDDVSECSDLKEDLNEMSQIIDQIRNDQNRIANEEVKRSHPTQPNIMELYADIVNESAKLVRNDRVIDPKKRQMNPAEMNQYQVLNADYRQTIDALQRKIKESSHQRNSNMHNQEVLKNLRSKYETLLNEKRVDAEREYQERLTKEMGKMKEYNKLLKLKQAEMFRKSKQFIQKERSGVDDRIAIPERQRHLKSAYLRTTEPIVKDKEIQESESDERSQPIIKPDPLQQRFDDIHIYEATEVNRLIKTANDRAMRILCNEANNPNELQSAIENDHSKNCQALRMQSKFEELWRDHDKMKRNLVYGQSYKSLENNKHFTVFLQKSRSSSNSNRQLSPDMIEIADNETYPALLSRINMMKNEIEAFSESRNVITDLVSIIGRDRGYIQRKIFANKEFVEIGKDRFPYKDILEVIKSTDSKTKWTMLTKRGLVRIMASSADNREKFMSFIQLKCSYKH